MPAADPPIAAIAAMALEVKPLLKGLHKNTIDGIPIYQGTLEGLSLLVVLSGVGTENARRAAELAVRHNPKAMVSLGFAGGLSKALVSGELLTSKEVRNLEGHRIPCDAFWKEPLEGTLLTVNAVVQYSEEKQALARLADAVDMESYAVAAIAAKHGVPFSSFRIISDSCDESIPVDFSPAFVEGKFNPFKAIYLILKKPSSIPSIFSLAYRSNVYANRLSRVFRNACRGLYPVNA